MTLSDLGLFLVPQWLRDWIQYQLLPAAGFTPYQLTYGLIRGAFDAVVFLFVALGLLTGGQSYMARHYALTPDIQQTVLKWAVVSDQIARQADIPREVPLVIWFKENGMQAENPPLCTGIIGAYDLVKSGRRPCFAPGPINDIEILNQLAIAAEEFKIRCPEISYFTQNPATIKKCYFAYNAGTGAAESQDPNRSPYVMNNYDDSYRGMVYSDVVLGTVVVQQIGAWPAHLAMQSLIAGSLEEGTAGGWSIALLDAATRIYDWLTYRFRSQMINSSVTLTFPDRRDPWLFSCLSAVAKSGDYDLRPQLNPIVESPILTQDVHGCEYALPGIDISSDNRKALIQAPLSGQLTTYTDQWSNTTIRIENEEWIVLLLHARSYLATAGSVERGQAVGVMGSVGISTGPHVHYVIYSKIQESFVDPAFFIP